MLTLAGWLAIALAFATHLLGHGASWEPATTFALAAVGVLPLAQLMGQATEALAGRLGPTWGGLMNATFGWPPSTRPRSCSRATTTWTPR
jgi:Ca2+:H+ antiporter